MKPYRVTILLLFVCILLTLTCAGMVYFTRQTDHHAIASASSGASAAAAAEIAASSAEAASEQTDVAIADLKYILNTDHATTLRRDQQLNTLELRIDETLQDVHALLTNGHTQASKNAKAAVQEAAQAVALVKQLKAQENQVLELLAVENQEFVAFFPNSTVHVTCGLSKNNDIECKVTKTPKKPVPAAH